MPLQRTGGLPDRRTGGRADGSLRPALSWPRRQLRFPLRHHAEHHAMSLGEVAPRRLLHVGGRHAAIAIEVLLEIVRGPDEVVVEVELVCLAAEAADALHPRQELRFER